MWAGAFTKLLGSSGQYLAHCTLVTTSQPPEQPMLSSSSIGFFFQTHFVFSTLLVALDRVITRIFKRNACCSFPGKIDSLGWDITGSGGKFRSHLNSRRFHIFTKSDFFFHTQVIHKLVPKGNSRTLNGVFFLELPICLASLFHLYYSPGGNIPNRINK